MNQNHIISSKSVQNFTSVKFRREMSQPVLSHVGLVSSPDSPIEKLATNDSSSFPSRPNMNYRLNQLSQSDTRQKQIKINASRISVDCLPIRQISRSRVNDPFPSPKGKKPTKKSFFFRSLRSYKFSFLIYYMKN